MTAPNDKRKIIEHYDLASPYYRQIWGDHIHHGYWETGRETKEEAQLALTVRLAESARIPAGSTILDVGCGMGASGIYLATKYHATVTGITISPVQAAMASETAKRAGISTAEFFVMDAENITLRRSFDVVWSIEAISHLTDKPGFFSRVGQFLKPGGTLALIDWFKSPELSPAQYESYIAPIEQGMFVQLDTVADYIRMIRTNLEISLTEELTRQCARTWEVSSELIRNRSLWKLAFEHGSEFVRFLRSFDAMKTGFVTGAFVYALIIAHKREPSL